jgi:hypothetical protein
VNRNWPAGAWETLHTSDADSFVWSPVEAGALHLRVISETRPTLLDEVALTVVAPALELQPFAQTDYRIGRVLSMSWNAYEITHEMSLEVNRDFPLGAWEQIYSGAETQFDWLIDGDAAEHVRFRVAATEELYFADTSDADITLYHAALNLDGAPGAGTLHPGDLLHLSWTFVGDNYPVELSIRRGVDGTWESLATDVSDGFDWIVTEPYADEVYLRTLVSGDAELLDSIGPYVIAPPLPELSFVWPVEAGIDTVGILRTLQWQWSNGAGAVRLEVSHSGENWQLLADSVAETSYDWWVTGPVTEDLHFRVTARENAEISATSISRAVVWPTLSINVIGGTWYVGQERWISWSRADFAGSVDLELSRSDRSQPWVSLATVEADSFLWTVTGPEADFAALRVRAVGLSGIEDTTDVPLQIREPRITVVAPNGGEQLDEFAEIRLRWIAEGIEGDVAIGLWRGDPVNRLDTLFLTTANDSSEIWTVAGPAAFGCYLVVLDASNFAFYDSSDAPFEIRPLAADEIGLGIPTEFALHDPYPNPFNAQATIAFDVPRVSQIRVTIFDVLGREVAVLLDESRAAGRQRVSWNAANFSSGLYFVRMTGADYVATRRLLLLK